MKYQEILTQDEIQQLIDACPEVFKKEVTIQKYQLIIKAFITTGMRDSELINSTVSWIIPPKNNTTTLLRIQKNEYPVKFTPKYISEREVPITAELFSDLTDFIGSRKGGFIFRSQNPKNRNRYNKRTIINGINSISKEVFNKTIGTHIFRRTFASYIYSNFKDVIQVQKLMGHGKPEVTWRYIKQIPTRENYNEIIDLDIFKYTLTKESE